MNKLIYLLLIAIILIYQNVLAKDSTTTSQILSNQSYYYENPYILYDFQIEKFPIRGLDTYLSLVPGIIFQDGIMYIRGGINNTIQFLLNDADITSPYNYAREVYIIPEAIQTLKLNTINNINNHNGTLADYVCTKLKRGDNYYRFSVNSQTDKFTSEGRQFLDTYSYRDHYITLLTSGPIIKDKAHFFIALENEDIGDTQKRFSKGYEFNNLVDINPANPDVQVGTPDMVDKMKYPDGFTPKNSSNRWAINAAINAMFKPFDTEIIAAFDWQKLYADDRPMLNILNDRFQYLQRYTFFINGSLKHQLTENQSYDLSLGYIQSQKEIKDDYFGSNWQSWTDSAKIAEHTHGDVIYRDAWRPQYNYLFNGFSFSRNGTLLNDYSIFKHNNWQVSGHYKNIVIHNNIFGTGFSYKSHIFREYSIDPFIMAHTDPDYRSSVGNHLAGEYFPSLEDINPIYFNRYLGTVYGYDRFGEEDDNGLSDRITEAWQPSKLTIYIHDQFKFKRLTLHAGLSYVHDRSGLNLLRDPENPIIDQETGQIIASEWKEKDSDSDFNPWFGLNLNIYFNHNVFFNYNKINMNQYGNNAYLSQRQVIAGGYYYLSNLNIGFNEHTITNYEFGYSGNLLNSFALSYSLYTKKIKSKWIVEQESNRIIPDDGRMAMGTDFVVSTKRFHKLTGIFSYSYLYTEDEGAPFFYQHKHSGFMDLDYRFGMGDGGPLLSQLGANLLLLFHSGHPFTKAAYVGGLTDPYNAGVDYMIDTRTRTVTGSYNSSTTPWNYRFDLSVDKTVNLISDIKFKFYMHIINLLNTKNVINVYELTGQAADDGFISDPEKYGPYYNAYGGQQYLNMYKAINIANGQAYWDILGKQLYSHPRQILVGVQISY